MLYKNMKNVLNSVQKEISVSIEKNHMPSEFFKDRKGLFVWSSFANNISGKATPTNSGAEFKVSSSDLAEPANDEQIEAALPEKHIFSESDVCAIISTLIEKQPNGEEGVLLNNGYANIFYTQSRVVRVCRYADDGEWGVDAWNRGGTSWDGGDRVFSPATEI